MRSATFCAALITGSILASSAGAAIQITEWMYSGGNGEFIELTNTGPAAVDLTGWSYDDSNRGGSLTTLPASLSSFGVVAAGETVLLTETDADLFRTAWGLPASQKVLGGVTNNLGRSDEINIYNSATTFDDTTLVDRLTYGDQTYSGTIRTQNKSGNIPPSEFAATTVTTGMVLSAVGDSYGSRTSAAGDIGNPGLVPEPTTLAAVGFLAGLLRRRR